MGHSELMPVDTTHYLTMSFENEIKRVLLAVAQSRSLPGAPVSRDESHDESPDGSPDESRDESRDESHDESHDGSHDSHIMTHYDTL